MEDSVSSRRGSSTRSPSSDSSALSTINVNHVARSAETMTPPTSVSDSRSVQNSVKAEDDASAATRPRRSRVGPITYNISQLSDAQLSSTGSRSRKRPREDDVGNTGDTVPRKVARKSLAETALSPSPSAPQKSPRQLQTQGLSSRMKDAGARLRTKTRELVEASKRKLSITGKRGAASDMTEKQRKLLKELDTGPRGFLDEIDLDASFPVPGQAKRAKKTQAGTNVSLSSLAPPPAAPNGPLQKTSDGKRVKKYMQAGLFVGQELNADSVHKKKTKASDSAEDNKISFMPLPMFKYLDNSRDFTIPFDIFAPSLRKGDEKPKDWHKVNRNRLVGEAKDLWGKEDRLASSMCVCQAPKAGELSCEDDCLNRVMQYECNEDNCSLPAAKCSNRAFAELAVRNKKGGAYDVGVEVVKTQNRGFGIRAARSFTPGQIIMEYTGEIISEGECQRRMREDYKDKQCYYLMELERNLVIDGTKGSMARFINHSCEPNCEVRMVKVNGTPRMAVYAGTGGIMTGEELTYDYNFDNFGETRQNCYCGAQNCRGFLSKRLNATEQKKLQRAEEARRKQAAVEAQKAAEVEAQKKQVKDARGSGWRGWVSVDDAEVKEELRAQKRAKEEAEQSSSRAMRLAGRRDGAGGGSRTLRNIPKPKKTEPNRRKTTALTELAGGTADGKQEEPSKAANPVAATPRKRRHSIGPVEDEDASEIHLSPNRKKPQPESVASESSTDSGAEIQVGVTSPNLTTTKTTVTIDVEIREVQISESEDVGKMQYFGKAHGPKHQSTVKYKQSTLTFARL